jgi:transposase
VRKKYGKRRNWSDDEKRMICAQTRLRGVSVSQVARRYDVNANQVFNWLKEPRFTEAEPAGSEPAFLPVEISEAREISFASGTPNPARLRSICAAAIGCGSRGHTMLMLLRG